MNKNILFISLLLLCSAPLGASESAKKPHAPKQSSLSSLLAKLDLEDSDAKKTTEDTPRGAESDKKTAAEADLSARLALLKISQKPSGQKGTQTAQQTALAPEKTEQDYASMTYVEKLKTLQSFTHVNAYPNGTTETTMVFGGGDMRTVEYRYPDGTTQLFIDWW